jgi:tetratricopeptide (TPR) repeat protein
MYYFARELKDHQQYAKASYYFERFLNEGKGWFEDSITTCFNLAFCYTRLSDEDKVLPVLLKSFTFDSPRAEICCGIGYYYKRKKEFAVAAKWFKLAASLEKPNSIGFVLPEYWGFIPNIEACCCLCEIGEFAEASKYNEAAGLCKPESQEVSINRQYIAGKLGFITS